MFSDENFLEDLFTVKQLDPNGSSKLYVSVYFN